MLPRLLFAFVAAVPLLVLAPDLAPTGTLRASFLMTNPVQGRVDPKTGAVSGPVADLVREIAKRRGVPFTILPVPDAAAVIESLKTGTADIGFLAYEAARAAQVDFSRPYLLMSNGYLVRADSPIKKSADVDRAGVKVGAVKGQSQEIFVSANLKNARVEVLPTMPADAEVAKMIVSGQLDAFAANRSRMEAVVQTSPQLRLLSDNFLVVGQAIVVNKGQTATLEELNRILADILATNLVKTAIERAQLTGVEAAK